jgi:NAD(P)-dependent dehydrogenase (short-subunit alcohol dehydrogenase family)
MAGPKQKGPTPPFPNKEQQAYHPSPAILDYATAKGAIVTFTKGLAQQMIERGIRVNCVAPGPVWTPLVVASFSKEKNE